MPTTSQEITLSDVYLRAFMGLITGVIGWPRYYLGHMMIGTLQSGVFLGGVGLVVYHFAMIMGQVLESAMGALSGQPDLHALDQGLAVVQQPSMLYDIGRILAAVGFFLWLVDLFFIPGLVKKHNSALKQANFPRR